MKLPIATDGFDTTVHEYSTQSSIKVIYHPFPNYNSSQTLFIHNQKLLMYPTSSYIETIKVSNHLP